MIVEITRAILEINSNAKMTIRGQQLDTCTIEWLEGTTPISKADIEAKMNEMSNKSNYANKEEMLILR